MIPNGIDHEIKTILVPTDFSHGSLCALKYAIALNKKVKAKLIILHVYHIPLIPGRTHHVSDPRTIQENLKLAEDQLDSLKNKISALNSVAFETRTAPGYGMMDIPEVIRMQNADLIIMGAKGSGGIKKVFFGSTTAKVIEHSTYPVLVIPEKAKYREIKTLGLAFDDEFVVPKIKVLALIARIFNARIEIFHVIETEEVSNPRIPVLNPLLKSFFKGIDLTYSTIFSKDTEEGINNYIKNKEIDVITMIPRKHNIFHKLFNSSLTKKMTFQSMIPLLIVPEG